MDKYFMLFGKWSIAAKVLPIVALAAMLKIAFHYFSWEILSLSPLFTSILAATTFLIGFLITGVISDFKESEKIPGEIAASLESMYDEAYIMAKHRGVKEAKKFIQYEADLVSLIIKWFYREEKTLKVLDRLSGMNDIFGSLDSHAGVSRMKQEQSSIRKMLIRIHTIRETQFAETAYAIAEFLAFFLVGGMIAARIEPFYEGMFFLNIVTFLVWYMIFLIRDLDDPFEYKAHGEAGSEISLKPIHDFHARIRRFAEHSQKQAAQLSS